MEATPAPPATPPAMATPLTPKWMPPSPPRKAEAEAVVAEEPEVVPPAVHGLVTPPVRKSTGRTQLLYQRSLKRSEKLKVLTDKHLAAAGVTFQPTLVSKPGDGNRTFEGLYLDGAQKLRKIEALRNDRDRKEAAHNTFKPQLTSRQRSASAGRSPQGEAGGGVADRLYKMALAHHDRLHTVPPAIEVDPECTFRPHVNRARPSPKRGPDAPGSPDFLQRNEQVLRQQEQRQRQREDARVRDELAQCTFTPNVARRRGDAASGGSRGYTGGSPVHERLYQLSTDQEMRRRHLKNLYDKAEYKECTFHPDVSRTQRGTHASALQDGVPIHERLHELHGAHQASQKARQEADVAQFPFSPRLSSTHQSAKGRGAWETRAKDLYEAGRAQVAEKREAERLTPRRREDEELAHCHFQPETNWTRDPVSGGLRGSPRPMRGASPTPRTPTSLSPAGRKRAGAPTLQGVVGGSSGTTSLAMESFVARLAVSTGDAEGEASSAGCARPSATSPLRETASAGDESFEGEEHDAQTEAEVFEVFEIYPSAQEPGLQVNEAHGHGKEQEQEQEEGVVSSEEDDDEEDEGFELDEVMGPSTNVSLEAEAGGSLFPDPSEDPGALNAKTPVKMHRPASGDNVKPLVEAIERASTPKTNLFGL